MRDWLADLGSLGSERVFIRHNPLTDRYIYNAAAALARVMVEGDLIGWREVPGPYHQSVEAVVWTESLNHGQCGLYTGYRIHYEDDLRPLSASIFCFYDGTGKSPCLKTKREALRHMRKWAITHGVEYMELNYG